MMVVFHKRAMKNGGVYYESVDYEAIAREYFHYTDPDRRDWYTLPPVLREDRVRAVRLAVETVLDDKSVYPKEAE